MAEHRTSIRKIALARGIARRTHPPILLRGKRHPLHMHRFRWPRQGGLHSGRTRLCRGIGCLNAVEAPSKWRSVVLLQGHSGNTLEGKSAGGDRTRRTLGLGEGFDPILGALLMIHDGSEVRMGFVWNHHKSNALSIVAQAFSRSLMIKLVCAVSLRDQFATRRTKLNKYPNLNFIYR